MTITNRMMPVHPGEVLKEEMYERDLSADELAKSLEIPLNRVSTILNKRSGRTKNTASKLSMYFRTTPTLWQNLQKTWNFRMALINFE